MRRPLFLTLLSVILLSPVPAVAADERSKDEGTGDSRVLAVVEKELTRLQEAQDKAAGWTSPSGEVAYFLLQGLAERSIHIPKPSEEDIKAFHMQPQGGTKHLLYSANKDSRLVKEVTWKQDKSGSFYFHTWYLYLRKEGKWSLCGSGRTTSLKDG